MKKNRIYVLTAAALLSLTVGCSQVSKTVSQTEKASESATSEILTESPLSGETETAPKAVQLKDFVGYWQLDGQKTNENLKNYTSVYDMFGTGLKDYGSSLYVGEDGLLEYSIGINSSGSGSLKVENGAAEAEVTSYEDTAADGKNKILKVFLNETAGAVYLIMEWDGEELYWAPQQMDGEAGLTGVQFPDTISQVYGETGDYEELWKLIISTLGIPADDQEGTVYRYNYVDLDEDGQEEILAVVTGPYTTGSGGSSGLWVKEGNGKLEVLQEFTLMQEPVIVSDEMAEGHHVLMVPYSGDGQNQYSVLKYKDGKYPNVSNGETADSLEGVSGQAVLVP